MVSYQYEIISSYDCYHSNQRFYLTIIKISIHFQQYEKKKNLKLKIIKKNACKISRATPSSRTFQNILV